MAQPISRLRPALFAMTFWPMPAPITRARSWLRKPSARRSASLGARGAARPRRRRCCRSAPSRSVLVSGWSAGTQAPTPMRLSRRRSVQPTSIWRQSSSMCQRPRATWPWTTRGSSRRGWMAYSPGFAPRGTPSRRAPRVGRTPRCSRTRVRRASEPSRPSSSVTPTWPSHSRKSSPTRYGARSWP